MGDVSHAIGVIIGIVILVGLTVLTMMVGAGILGFGGAVGVIYALDWFDLLDVIRNLEK